MNENVEPGEWEPEDEVLEDTGVLVPAPVLAVAESGERVDKWLVSQLPERSRAEVQRWIESGLVTKGGKALKASYRVEAGDAIEVQVPVPLVYAVEAEPIPLTIVYEDIDLLVIDKPAGMVVHPAIGNWHGTLVNAVLHHVPDLEGVGGTGRPGIVHRLDKDTSGLIVVAKNDGAHRALQAQFKDRTIDKTYLALVYGQVTPTAAEIRAPIGRDPHQRKRMAVVPEALGRPAVTRYEVVGYYTARASGGRTAAQLTLLTCHPLTGRTHQIRVHLAYIHHPLAGETVYSPRHHTALTCPRQFLHAHRLRFLLPATGEPVEFTSPLPADLQAVLDSLDQS